MDSDSTLPDTKRQPERRMAATKVLPPPLILLIRSDADLLHCQRAARDFSVALGFDSRAQWEIAIAVYEAVTNVFVYAGSGSLCLRPVPGDPPGLEFEAVSEGGGDSDATAAQATEVPGHREPAGGGRAVRRRALGRGLGTIRRVMDSLEIVSNPRATSVRARRWPDAQRPGT